MPRANQQTIEHWQLHVEAFKASGLTREAYCRENRLKVYQLDYWRRKQGLFPKAPHKDNTNGFVQIQVNDDVPEDSFIGLR